MKRLVLYGTVECCLCHRLESLVQASLGRLIRDGDVELGKRDITASPQWRDLYGQRIPVLTCDGVVVIEGRPEPEEVEQVLKALLG